MGPGRADDPINALLASGPLRRTPGLPGPPVLGFLACAAVVRRRAYLEAGGFHPVLFLVGEEQVLAMDLAARGWALAYVPEVVAVHEPSPHRPPARHRIRVELRNALLTAWLRRPVALALGRTVRLARAAVRDADARAALAAALARLPAAVAHRRPVPPHVEQAVRALEAAR